MLDAGRTSQSSPDSPQGLQELQHSPIKTTVLRAIVASEKFLRAAEIGIPLEKNNKYLKMNEGA